MGPVSKYAIKVPDYVKVPDYAGHSGTCVVEYAMSLWLQDW